MSSFALAQAGVETRPTFWRIGHVGETLFYYLAAVAVAIFLYSVYHRFATYARGIDDPFDRLTSQTHSTR